MPTKIEELGKKYLSYLKHKNYPAAQAVRLQLNRLVMHPHKKRKHFFCNYCEEYEEGTKEHRKQVIPE